MNGAVTLGELVGRLELLEVRCRRCGRHGRLSVARLIEEHGADLALPDLGTRLAAGCPRSTSTDWGARCFVVYPQLIGE
jgi:hypothetical protein